VIRRSDRADWRSSSPGQRAASDLSELAGVEVDGLLPVAIDAEAEELISLHARDLRTCWDSQSDVGWVRMSRIAPRTQALMNVKASRQRLPPVADAPPPGRQTGRVRLRSYRYPRMTASTASSSESSVATRISCFRCSVAFSICRFRSISHSDAIVLCGAVSVGGCTTSPEAQFSTHPTSATSMTRGSRHRAVQAPPGCLVQRRRRWRTVAVSNTAPLGRIPRTMPPLPALNPLYMNARAAPEIQNGVQFAKKTSCWLEFEKLLSS
jgi:hypothetical protein